MERKGHGGEGGREGVERGREQRERGRKATREIGWKKMCTKGGRRRRGEGKEDGR